MKYKRVATNKLFQEIDSLKSGNKKADVTILINSMDPIEDETEYSAIIRSISPEKIKYNQETDTLSITDWLYDITIPRASGLVVCMSTDSQGYLKTINYMIEYVNSTFTFQFNYV